MSKNIVLIPLVLGIILISGCVQQSNIPRNEKGQGFLVGMVTFTGVPCPPDTPKGPPCDGPYPNYEVIVYKTDGTTIVVRAYSDEDGNYKIAINEGIYIVYLKELGFNMKLVDKPKEIKIEAGKTVRLDINIDTGIR